MDIITSNRLVKMEGTRTLCHSCLSGDRELSVIDGSALELFLHLLGPKPVSSTDTAYYSLCWECVALLKVARRFQNRTWKAQAVLQNLHQLNISTIPCLSTLSTSMYPDPVIIKYEEDPSIPTEVKCSFEFETAPLPKLESSDSKPDMIKNELDTDDTSDNDLHIDEFIYETAQKNSTESDKKFSKKSDKKVSKKSDKKVSKKSGKKISKKLEVEIEGRKSKKRSVTRKSDSVKSGNTTEPKGVYRNRKVAKITKNKDLDAKNLEKHYTTAYLKEEDMGSLPNEAGVHPYKYKCESCEMSFKIILYLRRHMTFNHLSLSTPPYECLQCKASLPSRQELETHWREHCSMLRCSLCGAVRPQNSYMRKHLLSRHSYVYSCRECDARFLSKYDYDKHCEELHRKLVCEHCGRQFPNKATIAKHINDDHQSHKCAECNRTYPTYGKLRAHNIRGCTRTKRRKDPLPLDSGKAKELAYCVECDKQFLNVYRYKAHLSTAFCHTNKKPKKYRVPCPSCERVFNCRSSMKDHFALCHLGKSRFQCDICDKYFSSKCALNTHRLCVHEKIGLPKNKICDICGRGFSTNRILTHHRRTHTGERPFACAHCSAAFAQRFALKTHERTQHGRKPAPAHAGAASAPLALFMGTGEDNSL